MTDPKAAPARSHSPAPQGPDGAATRKEAGAGAAPSLVERLKQKGSIGLDLSPGDPDCWKAHIEIIRLLAEVDRLNMNYIEYEGHVVALSAENRELRLQALSDEGQAREAVDWKSAYNIACDERTAAEAEIARLHLLALEAIDSLEEWGAYADEFFRKRWGLESTIAGYRKRLDFAPASPSKEGETSDKGESDA